MTVSVCVRWDKYRMFLPKLIASWVQLCISAPDSVIMTEVLAHMEGTVMLKRQEIAAYALRGGVI